MWNRSGDTPVDRGLKPARSPRRTPRACRFFKTTSREAEPSDTLQRKQCDGCAQAPKPSYPVERTPRPAPHRAGPSAPERPPTAKGHFAVFAGLASVPSSRSGLHADLRNRGLARHEELDRIAARSGKGSLIRKAVSRHALPLRDRGPDLDVFVGRSSPATSQDAGGSSSHDRGERDTSPRRWPRDGAQRGADPGKSVGERIPNLAIGCACATTRRGGARVAVQVTVALGKDVAGGPSSRLASPHLLSWPDRRARRGTRDPRHDLPSTRRGPILIGDSRGNFPASRVPHDSPVMQTRPDLNACRTTAR